LIGALVVVALGALAFTIRAVFFDSTFALSGNVEPVFQTKLNFAEAGPISSIEVRPGASVQPGQVLAKQDDRVLQARLAADQAALAAANVKVAQLAGRPNANILQVIAAQAVVIRNQGMVTTVQRRIANSTLVAPSAGVVAVVGGNVGDTASPYGVRGAGAAAPKAYPSSNPSRLFPAAPRVRQDQLSGSASTSLIVLRSPVLKVVARVGESDIKHVHRGDRARVTLPALSGRRFAATVEKVAPAAVRQSGRPYFAVDLSVDFASRSNDVRPGMIADVSF
jgi:multidrug resistance efflux pump